MGLSDVQIAIAVGWGLRGLVSLLPVACLIVRGAHAHTRVLVLGWFLLMVSFVGSLAEYHDLGLRYARLAEVAIGSWFVASTYAAVFKLDPTAWMSGAALLVGSNALYTLAAVTTSSELEAGLIVIGAVAGVGALLQISASRPRNYFVEWAMVVAAALFYAVVALQTVFGPWVLAEWDRLAWAIIWEVAITLFYTIVVVGSWFYYIPGTVDGSYATDWFDMWAYVSLKNQWSVPPPKLAE